MILKVIKKFVNVEDKELLPCSYAFGTFFCILLGYYIILPLRDDLGVDLGTSTLSTLFVVSLFATVFVSPIASSYLSKPSHSREEALRKLVRYISIVNFVFYVSLQLVEIMQFRGAGTNEQLEKELNILAVLVQSLFFVWVGLQNNILMSCTWARCAEIFTSEGGKRLFGFFGAGGTLGQLVGSIIASSLAPQFSRNSSHKPLGFVLLGGGCIYFASIFAGKLQPISRKDRVYDFEIQKNPPVKTNGQQIDNTNDKNVNFEEDNNSNNNNNNHHKENGNKRKPRQNSILNIQLIDGFKLILRSHYLTSVCVFILLNNFTGSMFYFQKSLAASALKQDRGLVTAWFASINRNQAVVVLILQLFATGKILTFLGVIFSLMLTPFCCLVGLTAVSVSPIPVIVMFAEVLRKISNYTVSRPAREVLFTVVSQEEKYKAKVCIDTIVLRVGDTIAAGTFRYLVGTLNFTVSQVAMCGMIVCLIWMTFASYLGLLHTKLHKVQT